jgi:CTP synthase
MENEYILESARQLRHELGEDSVQFVHVALLPYLMASKELKTKPIQHSIRTLMSYGISPDFLIVRADTDIPEDMLAKIASASGIQRESVISAPTLDTIYRVPLAFHSEHLGEKLLTNLRISFTKLDMKPWENFLSNIDSSLDVIRIGMIGKYV